MTATGKSPERSVFVLMPFAPEFRDVYELTIKPVASELLVAVSRADDRPFHNRQVYDEIIGAIDTADVLIADLSEAKPNVFYEAGYAHARGKPVIPISCDEPRATPFDFAGFQIMFYDRQQLSQLRVRLLKVLHEVLCLLSDFHKRLQPVTSAQPELLRRVSSFALDKARACDWKRPNMYFTEREAVEQAHIPTELAYGILSALQLKGVLICANWQGEPVWMAARRSGEG